MGCDRVKSIKCDTGEWDEKCHTFWMTSWLICCFNVIFFYIERKWLLMKNVATILPLKLSEKFQRFNAIDESIKMLKIVEFPIFFN